MLPFEWKRHFMYLYNKNVLEYAQISHSGPKSMICDIEGLSRKQEEDGN